VLEVIEEEGLVARAESLGARLAQGLQSLQEKLPLITEIRACGLMIGVDLARDKASEIKRKCAERGLLITTVGEAMLRLLPPLVLTEEQAEQGLRVLCEVIAEASGG